MDRPDAGHPPAAVPPGLEGGPPGRGAARGWRRAAGLAGVVLLPALVVRGCVLDTFVIRSDSMAPLFRGGAQDGDRLLVLRDALDPRPLARWDVVVVDAEVDRELPAEFGALLKRVAALPGERVALRDGDVWVAAGAAPLALARKPAEDVPGLLVTVHEAPGLAAPWSWEGPGERRDDEAGTRLVAGAEPGRASYTAAVDDGLPGEPGGHAVGDTALELELGECDAVLELVLREGAGVFRARLADAARGGAALHHNLAGVVDADPGFAGLRPGARVLAFNVDGQVRVLVDGRTLLAWDQPDPVPAPPGDPGRNDPGLLVAGGSVTLRRVAVRRDLHWSAEGPWGTAEVPLTGAQVFLLGDHALHSRDSRAFGPADRADLRGRPFARYAPLARAGRLTRLGAAP